MTWRPLPGGARPRPLRLTGALDLVAQDLGAPDAHTLAALFGRWDEIAGPSVAAHSRPLWLGSGALVVAVDDPAHATELRYRGGEVLDRLARVTGRRVADRLEVRVRVQR